MIVRTLQLILTILSVVLLQEMEACQLESVQCSHQTDSE